jgi:hypothetical protein
MYIPEGSIVTIVDGPLDGLRMVEVVWDEKKILLFTEDLRALGALVTQVQTFEPTVS